MPLDGGLPSGTVTFLFTDIEGSTDLLKRLGRDRYGEVLAEHAEVLRAAVEAHGGRVVDTQGDALFCAFRSAREAVSAAIDAQLNLAAHDWPEQVPVRVRMGLHSSEPKAGDVGYVGIGVHRAARVGAAAHGGQVLVSETARALVADDLAKGVSLRDLGMHRLKDIDEPVRLYQVVASGLQERFPPPRTVQRGLSRRARLALVAVALVVAGDATAAVLLTTGSASAKPVRLVANSIAVLDPRFNLTTGDLLSQTPLASAGAVTTDPATGVWQIESLHGRIANIDPQSGQVIRRFPLHHFGSAVSVGHGRVWVGLSSP